MTALLLQNARKPGCGSTLLLTRLVVRAAPFALLLLLFLPIAAPGETLTRDQIAAAMKAALNPNVAVEILDWSKFVPAAGRLEFTIASLPHPPADRPNSPLTWRGRLYPDHGSSASVWATVRLTETRTWLVSAGAISARVPIEPAQIESKTGPRFPLGPQPLSDISDIAGRVARRSIPAGRVLFPEMFEDPPAVARGDAVRVEVLSGAIRLAFDARAETGGRPGDSILVWDPASQKRLKAKVNAKGKVTIEALKTTPGTANTAGGSLRTGAGGPED